MTSKRPPKLPPPSPRRTGRASPPPLPFAATVPALPAQRVDYGPPPFGGDEIKTPAKGNPTLAEAQAILGAFDGASPGLRLELVEMVRGFVDLSAEDRKTLLALAARFAAR